MSEFEIPGFNPRARKERDIMAYDSLSWFTRFNPRARKERDLLQALGLDKDNGFQSTRP